MVINCLLFQMYFLIFWDEYCQVVPRCWVDFTKQIFQCPPSKYNITNAIKKKIKPANDWNVYNYRRIVGPYDGYDKAREAEKSSIDLSSDDNQLVTSNNPEQRLPVKRLITKKKFYDDTDDEIHTRKHQILLQY